MDSFMPMSPAMLPQMMPTAGGMQQMMPFISPDQIAQNQADMAQWQQRQQMAQALMNTQIPAGGRATGIAGIFSKVLGAIQNNRNNDRLSDLLKQQFQIENQAAQAKRQQDLADEYRKMQEDIYKTREGKKAEREFAPMQFQASGAFDPSTGAYTPNAAAAAQEVGIKSAEAQAAARASAMYREAPGAGEIAGLNAKIAQAKAMGATPDQLLAMVTGQAGQNPNTQVVGNMLVDKRTGKATPILDPTTGKAIDVSAGAKSNAVVEKAQGGLADNVLQYVATATKTPIDQLRQMSPDQVQKVFQDKGGRDWGTAIASAIPGIGSYVVSKANPNLDAFATGAQAMEARIQHPVGTIPYNAELLARKSSIGPEKTDAFNAAFIKKALEDAAGTTPGSAQPLVNPGASGVPDAAAQRLKANPSEAAQFDQIFGPGSAAKVLGGG